MAQERNMVCELQNVSRLAGHATGESTVYHLWQHCNLRRKQQPCG